MRPFARPCVTLLVAFTLLVATFGCAGPATTAPVPTGPRIARVELVNLSECDWRITLVSTDGRETSPPRLPAHATLRLEIPGGDYTITQTALNGPAAVRRFPAHLEPGESYRWRLATLLTGQAGAAP